MPVPPSLSYTGDVRRLAVAAALGSLALAAPGDRATATFSGTALTLTLHYWMTCGQPGAGPVAITLPSGIRIAALRALLNAKPAPVLRSGRTVDVTLPKPPPGVTCMSIGEGTLRVTIGGLHAPRGTYTATARVNRHSFRPSFRVG
jgi:hypothetical protein